MKTLNDLLNEYTEKFNDNVPLYCMSGDESEIIKAIQHALDTGEPIEVEEIDGVY